MMTFLVSDWMQDRQFSIYIYRQSDRQQTRKKKRGGGFDIRIVLEGIRAQETNFDILDTRG